MPLEAQVYLDAFRLRSIAGDAVSTHGQPPQASSAGCPVTYNHAWNPMQPYRGTPLSIAARLFTRNKMERSSVSEVVQAYSSCTGGEVIPSPSLRRNLPQAGLVMRPVV